MATESVGLDETAVKVMSLADTISRIPKHYDEEINEALYSMERMAKRFANFMAYVATIDPLTLTPSIVEQVHESYNLTALETEVAAATVALTYDAIVGGAMDVVTLS